MRSHDVWLELSAAFLVSWLILCQYNVASPLEAHLRPPCTGESQDFSAASWSPQVRRRHCCIPIHPERDMSLDSKSLGLGAAIVAAIVYSICALFVAVFPTATTAALSYVLHLDFATMARPLSWASYCVGVVSLSVFVGLVVASAAAFYNRFSGSWAANA